MRYPHVIPWSSVQSGDSDTDPNDGLYDKRILAEGDSWFTLGGIDRKSVV